MPPVCSRAQHVGDRNLIVIALGLGQWVLLGVIRLQGDVLGELPQLGHSVFEFIGHLSIPRQCLVPVWLSRTRHKKEADVPRVDIGMPGT